MKTIIYIDGFNLYQSVLTKTPHKWLDIHELFSRKIVHSINPSSDIEQVKFFTARIKGKYASDPKSPDRQHAYMMALEKKYPGLIEVIEGKHIPVESEGVFLEPQIESVDIGKAKIMRLEEKQTDVNIALNMYRDCSKGLCEQIVLVSNDSDLQPALSMIQQDFPGITRGLVIPSTARISLSLEGMADWTRHGINEIELIESQLPDRISYSAGRKTKHVKKPNEWG